MQPLHELLHRIQWDRDFGRGEFALGYDDRVAHEERVVPFRSIRVEGSESFSFFDEHDGATRIPLHRVRTVYKDGVAIWQRPRVPRPGP